MCIDELIDFLNMIYDLYKIPIKMSSHGKTLLSLGNYKNYEPDGAVLKYNELTLSVHPAGLLQATIENEYKIKMGPVLLKNIQIISNPPKIFDNGIPVFETKQTLCVFATVYFEAFRFYPFDIDEICNKVNNALNLSFTSKITDYTQISMNEEYGNTGYLFECVKNGDVSRVEKFMEEIKKIRRKEPIVFDTTTGLTNLLFMLSGFAFMSSEGGLNAEQSFAMYQYFASLILNVKNAEESIDLFSRMAMEFAKTVNEASTCQYSYLVQKACHYIKSHLNEKITVGMVANHVNASDSYIRSIFKKETGQTIQKYVELRKLETACVLLKFTQNTIAYIGQYLGYSESYFCKIFNKHYHMTPYNYRKNRIVSNKVG